MGQEGSYRCDECGLAAFGEAEDYGDGQVFDMGPKGWLLISVDRNQHLLWFCSWACVKDHTDHAEADRAAGRGPYLGFDE